MKKTGIDLIAQERKEQIEKHGYSIELDSLENEHYQLSEAAGILTCLDTNDLLVDNSDDCCPVKWNEIIWKKMFNKSYKERLIIAGALIAAEIDRLQAIEK